MANFLMDSITVLASLEVMAEVSKKLIIFWYPGLSGIFDSWQFSVLSFISIVIICILCIFRGILINVNYRIANYDELDLTKDMITSGTDIDLYMQKEDEGNAYDKFLCLLKYKMIMRIEHAKGVRVNPEALGSDFEITERSTKGVTIVGDLDLYGRRKIKLYVDKDPDSRFEGQWPISIKIFVSPKCKLLRIILSTIAKQGFSKINIS